MDLCQCPAIHGLLEINGAYDEHDVVTTTPDLPRLAHVACTALSLLPRVAFEVLGDFVADQHVPVLYESRIEVVFRGSAGAVHLNRSG